MMSLVSRLFIASIAINGTINATESFAVCADPHLPVYCFEEALLLVRLKVLLVSAEDTDQVQPDVNGHVIKEAERVKLSKVLEMSFRFRYTAKQLNAIVLNQKKTVSVPAFICSVK